MRQSDQTITIVLMAVVMLMVPIYMIVGLHEQKVAASTRITGTPGDPALEQTVVWDKADSDARAHHLGDRAHYLNGFSPQATAKTACGIKCGESMMNQNVVYGTVAQMEAEKRIPCASCIRALSRFTETMNARPRDQMPDSK